MLSMALNFIIPTASNLFSLVITLLCLAALLSAQSAPLLARTGKVLQVLVPGKSAFEEFVECSDDNPSVNDNFFNGFCIDVFKSALDILIPNPDWTQVNYTCYKIGTKNTYDNLITALHVQNNLPFDVVVGDITISSSRLKNASFTQSYLDSGIVLVTPAVDVPQASFGVLVEPFTTFTWVIIIVSTASTGLALWLLERNDPSYRQRTESRAEHFKQVFWFVTSVLVFFKRESVKDPLAKFVMMAWIIYSLLLSSSYIASLSSILTVNKLSPTSLTIEELSSRNLPVGYQVGSIVFDYLKEKYNIANLVQLNNTRDYLEVFHTKKVVAVVDEMPYISLFLSSLPVSNCKFAVISKRTIGGWGFAFFNETLSAAFSVAILNLSESGQLQKLQDGWKVSNFQCPSQIQSTQLDAKDSYGPFMLFMSAMLACILIYLYKHGCVWNKVFVGSNQRDTRNLDRSLTKWFSAKDYLDRL